MTKSLFTLVPQGDWPRCFHDKSKLCGDPDTRVRMGVAAVRPTSKSSVADGTSRTSARRRAAPFDARSGMRWAVGSSLFTFTRRRFIESRGWTFQFRLLRLRVSLDVGWVTR